MKIIYKETFVQRLEKQLKYLSENSPKSSRNLKIELKRFLRIKLKYLDLLDFKKTQLTKLHFRTSKYVLDSVN